VYFREKPFDLEEMIALIDEILQKTQGSHGIGKSGIFYDKSHQ
jgi:hypothetical protein